MAWLGGKWWGAIALVGMACTRGNPAFDEDGGGSTDGPATTGGTTTGLVGEEGEAGETTRGSSGGGSSGGGSSTGSSSGEDSSVDGSGGPPGQCDRDEDCAKGMVCNLELGMCVVPCPADPDADDDGMETVACGGPDCDDGAFGYGLGDWAHCGGCGMPCGVGQACSSDGNEGVCMPANRVFVTSLRYDGNLEGLVGADEICQGHAMAEELGGTFRAFLADSDTGLEARLQPSKTPYVRLDGVRVADNREDLLDGSLDASLSVTETRTRVEGFGVHTLAWTGRGEGLIGFDDFCNDWTYDGRGCGLAPCGATGDATRVNVLWESDGGERNCDLQFRLYCIEQAG